MPEREQNLRPNCLLTRLPLFLIDFRKTIFHSSANLSEQSQYLIDHGYYVQKLSVFGLAEKSQCKNLKKILNKLIDSNLKCHVILINPPGQYHHGDFEKMKLESLTISRQQTCDQLLDTVIEKAELDFINGHSTKIDRPEFHLPR